MNNKCVIVLSLFIPLPFIVVFTEEVEILFNNVKIFIDPHPV